MAIIVSQVKTTLEESSNQDRIWEAARKTARLKPEEIEKTYLVKSSIDARKQDHILLVSSVGFELKHPEEESLEQLMRREQEVLKRTQNSRNGQFVKIQHNPPQQFTVGTGKLSHPPVIVGFGPAGMFAGLALARMGYCPVILERGADVDSRVEAVQQFWKERKLSTESNVQFGEGGAGTFSDGKLNTLVKDPLKRNQKVLEILVEHGADPEILYVNKPHIGTDVLSKVVKNIREATGRC